MFTLRWVRSIKLKFAAVIVAAIATAVVMSQVGYVLGWPIWLRPLLATAVSLALVQFLAHGMTSPLREMAHAAKDISRGEYGRRVHTPSVDEVGQLARAFNTMAADLADADRQRRELIANVSHELRTPIAGMRAALENMIDGVAAPTAELMGAMHGRVVRLQRLVEELLDLSRLESGTIALHALDVSLDDVVRGAVDEVRFDHRDAEIRVVAGADVTVRGDAERLHQVVTNLLDNALSHGAAPVVVTVSSTADEARLSVLDHGPGLADGTPALVFERFYRAGTADGGSGLGLAITRWLVELHGGTISATNDESGGARFDVHLPRVRATAHLPT